jgi:PAS domain S-box-containing protein
MTRILLADDHEFVRHGVRSLLESHPDFEVCGEAVNGSEAVSMAERLQPDVVVLDISMPEMNGLEAARVIRNMLPKSEILILSQHNTNEVKKAALNAGARGYIAKSDVARELLAAVVAVSQHKPVLTQSAPQDSRPPVFDPVPWVGPRPIRRGPARAHANGGSKQSFQSTSDSVSGDGDGHFRSLVNGAPVFIWASDAAGQCTFFNQSFLVFTGRTLEEEKGTGWTQRIHPDEARASVQAFFEAIQERRAFTMEFRLQRANGEYRWFQSNGAPQLNGDGSVRGYIGSCVDITERKHSEAELRRAHDDLESLVEDRTVMLRRLSSRLLQIQDDERRRIARELHDSLGQLLTAAQINLDMCLSSETLKTELLTETKSLLERSLSETRTLSHLLHPPLLDEAGLDSAVRWYVDGFGRRSGIRVNLDLPPDLHRLPSTVEIATFRVLQESLTNVHRHSGSQSVDIRLARTETAVTLEVQDHGKGVSQDLLKTFQKKGFNVGVGLAGMRERVKELGGELNIRSDSQGTLIRVQIPVHAAMKGEPVSGAPDTAPQKASTGS